MPALAEIQAGSPGHLLTLVACAALCIAAVRLGRAARPRGREPVVGKALAWAAIIIWIPSNLWYLLPAHFDPAHSFPLHICDLAGLLAPLALLGPRRPLRAVVYFWALALTTQGFFTPVVTNGPTTIRFWLFWSNHLLVVLIAIYDVAVRGYRPRLVDAAGAFGLTIAYGLIILPLNIAMGWNYLYIGPSKPDTPSILDALGPWPGRLAWMVVIGIGLFAVVWLPWPLVAWFGRSRRRGLRSPVAKGAD